jgi:hypothetical protein
MKCFLALDLPASSTVTSSFIFGLTPLSTPYTGFSFTGTISPAHPRNHVGYMISTCTYRQSRRVQTKKWCECQRSKEMDSFCNHGERSPSSTRRAASTRMGSAPHPPPTPPRRAPSPGWAPAPQPPPAGRPRQGWKALRILRQEGGLLRDGERSPSQNISRWKGSEVTNWSDGIPV